MLMALCSLRIGMHICTRLQVLWLMPQYMAEQGQATEVRNPLLLVSNESVCASEAICDNLQESITHCPLVPCGLVVWLRFEDLPLLLGREPARHSEPSCH